MSEQIELKQWAGSTVTPKDDACMYDIMLGDSGLITGCDLTSLGSGQVRIGAGRGIIKGRQFVVLEHTITVALTQSGTKLGRIYIHMDLAQTTPISILSETAATLTPLIQEDDCNLTNGVYEIELGTYNAGVSAITDLTKTIPIAQGYKELKEAMELELGGCTFETREDGAYVVYTPPGGADPVSKKLGSKDPLKLIGSSAYQFSVYSNGTSTWRNVTVTNQAVTIQAENNGSAQDWSEVKAASNDYFDLTDAIYIMYKAKYSKGSETTNGTDYLALLDEQGILTPLVNESYHTGIIRGNYVDVSQYSGLYKLVFATRTGTHYVGYSASEGQTVITDITIL